MGKGRIILKYIVPMTLCLVFYQNCGVSKYGIGGDPPNNGLDSEGNSLQALSCDDPSTYKTANVQLNFSDPGNTCDWGVGENLAQQDTHLTAINRQVEDINIPDGALLCSFDLNIPRQAFRYDDMFYLSMNGVMVATNAFFSLEGLGNNLLTMNWENVRGTEWPAGFNTATDQDYCLGELEGLSTCTWPATDTNGEIEMTFNRSVFDNIVSLANNSIEIAVVGDNDAPSDCRHTGLNIEANLFYVD